MLQIRSKNFCNCGPVVSKIKRCLMWSVNDLGVFMKKALCFGSLWGRLET